MAGYDQYLIPVGPVVFKVSVIDAAFVCQWKWRAHRTGNKRYPRRSGYPKGRAIYLSHVVLQRAGKPRPSPQHVTGFWDGDSLNCTRENVCWMTKQEQGALQSRLRKGKRQCVIVKPIKDGRNEWTYEMGPIKL